MIQFDQSGIKMHSKKYCYNAEMWLWPANMVRCCCHLRLWTFWGFLSHKITPEQSRLCLVGKLNNHQELSFHDEVRDKNLLHCKIPIWNVYSCSVVCISCSIFSSTFSFSSKSPHMKFFT